MRKRKTLIALVAALVLALTLGVALTACDRDDSGPKSKNVARPNNVFTNDIDKTDSPDLTEGATLVVSSFEENKANLTDGKTDTAWTAANAENEYIEITFAEATDINTIVLRENGNYITSFRFQRLVDNRWTDFYRQDRVERYRYCSFDKVTTDKIRILIDSVEEGRSVSLSEIEVYNIAPKTYDSRFMVSSYFNVGDYRNRLFDGAGAAALDTITDVIIFEFTYWLADGSIVYMQEDGTTGADPSFFLDAVEYIRTAAGDRDVKICVDMLPPAKDANGIFHTGLPGNTDTLVANIAKMAADFDIDGIDFDWEYPKNPEEWKWYGDLMVKLKDAMGPQRYVTVALSSYNVSFTPEQISKIDYVQIMGYDRFDLEGNNASFRSGAYLPMRYFINLGFKPEQLVAGLPVYGRPAQRQEIWTNYNDPTIQGEFTYWDNKQTVIFNNEPLLVYVTGAAMAADKTAYAIEQGFAGIMMFRGAIDFPVTDERSVTRAIGNTIAERIA